MRYRICRSIVFDNVSDMPEGTVAGRHRSAWTLTYLRLTKGPAVEEPTALLPDEPLEPEPLPEVVEESVSEDDVSEAVSDEADDTDQVSDEKDILPEDF